MNDEYFLNEVAIGKTSSGNHLSDVLGIDISKFSKCVAHHIPESEDSNTNTGPAFEIEITPSQAHILARLQGDFSLDRVHNPDAFEQTMLTGIEPLVYKMGEVWELSRYAQIAFYDFS